MDILFRYFEHHGYSYLLSEINLTQKLIVLLLLVGAHRLSTIKLFSIDNMVLNDLLVTFLPTVVLKHSRKGKLLDKFEYRLHEDKTLCVIVCLKEYTSRRSKHEGFTTDHPIIILRKRFKEASINTMTKCIRDIFTVNNIVNFSHRSSRVASSSIAKHIDVNINEIIKR